MVIGWRSTFALAATAAAAIAIACGPGFLDGVSGGATVLEAGAADAAGIGATEDSGAACTPRVPPPRPTGAVDGPDVAPLLFAFERLRVHTSGPPDAGGPPPEGLDLDGRCTCARGTDSCTPTSVTTRACDGERGEDNALALLFNQLTGVGPADIFPQSFATDAIAFGRYTLLVEVRAWNGLPEDPSVIVTLRGSTGLDREDGGRARPSFDGDDLWEVDPRSVLGGVAAADKDCRDPSAGTDCFARAGDVAAYVTGGKLVTRPRLADDLDAPVNLTVRTSAGALSFDLFDFVLVGDLRGATGATGGRARLEGEIAGRIDTRRYLEGIATLPIVVDEPPVRKALCETGYWPIFQTSICIGRDIARPGRDNATPLGACEMFTAGISFAASPAKIGRIKDTDAGLLPCTAVAVGCP